MSVDVHLGLPNTPGRFPLLAQLLVSDHCNHTCAHCYQLHGNKGEMSFAEIEQILEELARLGVLFVSFSGGEATLRSDLPDMLRAARARGFAIILQTNGYQLSDALLDEIARVGVWRVRISVYSDVPREHDAVTHVPDSFERTTESIRKLRARGVSVTLVSPLTSLCTATPERLEALAKALDCELETSTALGAREDGSGAPFAVMPSDSQLDAYYRTELARGNGPLAPRSERLAERPCGACSAQITVHSDGSVRPCTDIPLEFDHIQRSGAGAIAKITEHDAFHLIANIRWRDLHGCRDCALMPWCSRCHGSAAWEQGDLFGPQPSACVRAVARYKAALATRHVPAAEGGPRGLVAQTADVGPFELSEDGTLHAIPDRLTPRDLELRARYRWVRPSRSDIQRMAGLIPPARLVRRRDEQPRCASLPERAAP